MTSAVLIVFAVAAVSLAAVAIFRRFGVPAPVVLVIVGLIIGFLPFVPDVSLDPHLVLLGLLPLLVFDAAVTASPSAFRRDAPSIGVLAILLVMATAVAVALVAHELGHLSWPMAFVLGTAVGPTDAAAATSIARRLGLPRRLTTLLDGEALFNDATALVLYAAAVTAATTGRFSVGHTAAAVAYAAIVGAAIGAAVGMAGRWLGSYVNDPPIEIAGSLLLAYAAYLPAEALHASGVLAAVTAGLYLGWHSSGSAFSARSRLQSTAFWEALVFLVNAALFILVGLSFHTFAREARGSVADLALTAAAVVGTVMVVRLAWIWAFGRVLRAPHVAATAGSRIQPAWRERVVLGWSGMRGAITLAALLAVPHVTTSGRLLAGRDDAIYLGFAVILVTLLTQGLTLPVLVRRLGLREHPAVADAERQARIALTRATLDHLDRTSSDGLYGADLTDRLRAVYAGRLRRLETVSTDSSLASEAGSGDAAAGAELRRDLISFQRQALAERRRQGAIGTTSLRTLERELDLEETRLAASGGAQGETGEIRRLISTSQNR